MCDSAVGLRAKKGQKHNLGNKSCKVPAISISICSILVAALERINEDVKSIPSHSAAIKTLLKEAHWIL